MFVKGELIGKYRVEGSLGSGAYAMVYLATDTLVRRKVALKVPHNLEGDREEFLAEARLLASLDHPNIVQVYTAEIIQETAFIVMEYVEGESLARRIKQAPPDGTEALEWFTQIARAVEYAHQRRIIHRDLRPANVLLSKGGQAKVADFGTSKLLEQTPFDHTRVGSPPYMAPEQFQGKASPTSDLYALGVTLYEMLTGQLPLFASSVAEMEALALATAPLPPARHNPAIPPRVSDVVMRCLAKEPAQRPPSIAELLYEIHQSKRGESVDVRELDDIRGRIKAREPEERRLCWNCRKPLPLRTAPCPYCHESQD